MVNEVKDRRPIKTREKLWAKNLAVYLQRRGVTPNIISLFSILFAIFASASFVVVFSVVSVLLKVVLFIFSAAMIQGRLICNLLDGMVAIEGRSRSAVGAVYNEVPDRVSDSMIFVAIGYGLSSYFSYAPSLAWCTAFMAVMTAYIRLLGGSVGLPQKFLGPMAKQHRMALLTGGSIISVSLSLSWSIILFITILWIIMLGSAITTCYRMKVVMADLKQRGL